MAITKNIDYVGEGLGRLLQQFKDKPRVASFLKSWLREAQALEDAGWDLYVARELQSGRTKGALLDIVGRIVGQQRQGMADDLYLLCIIARIAANRSRGKRIDLIKVLKLLVSGAKIYVQTYPPDSIMMYPLAPVLLPPVMVGRDFMAKAAAAGVLLMFVWSGVAPANTLIAGSINGGITQPTAQQSPGSINSGLVGQGGKAASVIQVQGGS